MALFKPTKRSKGTLPCDEGLLYEVLTDYDSYFEWMPAVVTSKLLAVEGDLAIAEFTLAEPPNERVVIECIHTKNQMVLARPIEGNLPVSRIEWNISPGEGGQVQATLTIEGIANWRWLVGSHRKFMNAAGCLEALRSHISVFATDASVAGPEGEKILELLETEEGLEFRIRGRKYTLKAEA